MIAVTVAVTLTAIAMPLSVASNPASASRGGPYRSWLTSCDSVPGSEGVACGDWSGYTAQVAASAVSAEFQVPAVSCDPADGYDGNVGYWVGVQGPESGSGAIGIAQAGVQAVCQNGQPAYSAFTVSPVPTGTDPQPGEPIPVSEPVEPGDDILAAEFQWGGAGGWGQILEDVTQDWYQFVPVTNGPVYVQMAAVAAESDNGGVTPAGSYTSNVSSAAINWAPIGQSDPTEVVQDPMFFQASGGQLPGALLPSPLDSSGEGFTLTWVPPPGVTMNSAVY
jgi:hypothetical protein